MSICGPVSLSAYLSHCLSAYLPIYLPVYRSSYLASYLSIWIAGLFRLGIVSRPGIVGFSSVIKVWLLGWCVSKESGFVWAWLEGT